MIDPNKAGAKRLIINADDLGLTLGITRGIVEAHKSGLVTSASAIVNTAAATASFDFIREQAPFLGLGLHINLTKGYPLTEGKTDITDTDGLFLPVKKYASRQAKMDLTQVEAEVRAQIAQFVELAGKHPDHINAHQHVMYLNTDLLAILLDVAAEIDVPIRRARADEYAQSGGAAATSDMIAERNIRTTDSFISRYYGAHKVSLGELLNVLMDIGEGTTELMCHPGYADSDLERYDDYVEWREMELHALTHPSAREVVISQQISVTTFADL